MMKRVTILTAAMVLAILAAGAPAAWAGETSPPAAAGVPGLEQATLAVIPTASTAGTPLPHAWDCEDRFEARPVADPAGPCNFGAPRCSSSSQCDPWCFPLVSACLSGCCVCQ